MVFNVVPFLGMTVAKNKINWRRIHENISKIKDMFVCDRGEGFSVIFFDESWTVKISNYRFEPYLTI